MYTRIDPGPTLALTLADSMWALFASVVFVLLAVAVSGVRWTELKGSLLAMLLTIVGAAESHSRGRTAFCVLLFAFAGILFLAGGLGVLHNLLR